MIDRFRGTGLLAAVALLAAACGGVGAATPPASESPAAVAPPDASEEPPASGTVPPPTADAGTATPVTAPPTAAPPTIDATWAHVDLTDVATGETFRIADLAGRAVIVETMAIWCANCRAQQGEVYRALDELDPARVAYVLLDVDPNETGESLARYRTDNGFTGTYAIAGREVARALAQQFGDQVLNPPSTPMILIGSDGTVTLTGFGHKSAEAVVELARDHGA
jgi:thiol-disulfide isomerase/thioredoxin